MAVEKLVCDDCRSDRIALFMVKNELWLTVADRKAHLCLPCFENRLGRKVTLYDLRPCQVSYSMLLGAYVAQNTPAAPPVEVLLDAESFVSGERRFTFTGGQ